MDRGNFTKKKKKKNTHTLDTTVFVFACAYMGVG
jgi:hypothetical protein